MAGERTGGGSPTRGAGAPRAIGSALAIVAVTLTVVLPRPASAVPTYRGTAVAAGFRVTFVSETFPLTSRPLDVSGPLAQAISTGATKDAFASLPYPGEFALATASLGAGITGAPVPTYPLMISANSGDPEPEPVAQGPYTLEAKVSETSVAASGAFAPAADTAPSIQSAADVAVAEDGTTTAVATSTATGIVAGPLRIAKTISEARVVQVPGTEPKSTSSFSISGVTVDGTPVELRDGELLLADQSVGMASSATPVTKTLEQAGIDVTFHPAEESADGETSAGITITFVNSVSAPTVPEGSTLDLTLGQVFASAAPASTGTPVDNEPAITVSQTTPGNVPNSSSKSGAQAASSPVADRDGVAPDVSTGVASGRSEDPPSVPSVEAPLVSDSETAAMASSSPSPVNARTPGGFSYYLVIVVGALATFVALQAMRLGTARRRNVWIS